VLKVVGDILLALDSSNLALQLLLDLSVAFDTVDHDTLLRRLQTSYGLDGVGVVIKWFASYLSGRTQHVRTLTTMSLPSPAAHGVPQGSVLGPILFLLYDADLLKLINVTGCPLTSTQTTLKSTASVSRVTSTPSLTVTACFDEVSSWIRANRLQVNPSKIEVLLCSSGRRQHQIPTSPVRIGSAGILCSRSRGIPTSVCENVSPPPSDRALQHYVRFGVFGVVFHNTPC